MSTDSDVMRTVVQSLCERINSPRSLSVWLCFQYNQEALLDLPLTDIATNDTPSFQLDYFITEYLSKYKGLKTSINQKAVALGKWRLAEIQCKEINIKFREYRFRPFTGRVEAALFRAQRKIAAVLGTLNVALALDSCKWGPGATFDMRREDATPDNKISRSISVTPAALPYMRALVESDPHWVSCFTGIIPDGAVSLLPMNFKIVRGSRFLTVPKSAKTDRCIAAEPTGNSFLQQGVHKYLRRRLMRFGVDLDKQSINQQYAQDAYTAELSTLDLSMASDTISRELLHHLLPLDWAHFLDALRSPETQVNGEWIRTEKFASMGNAFCFELETLIFWALASSVEELQGSVDAVTVYGDDIIVPRRSFNSVVEILRFCGFTVNEKKSFYTGNFFESCGKHYHRSLEVTPVYQKEKLLHPSELIRAHNRLYRFASRVLRGDGKFIVSKALKVLSASYTLRPFPRIPEGTLEDGGYLRPLSDFTLDKNHGFRCHVLDYKPRFSEAREDALYAYKLRRFIQQNPDALGYAVRVSKGAWRTKVRWISELASSGSINPEEPDRLEP